MAGQRYAQPENRLFIGLTLLLTFAFILPAVLPGIFGWFYGLLAIPVFIILMVSKTGRGNLIIRNSVILAGATAIIFHQILPALLFSFTFIPLGYSLYSSGKNQKSVASAATAGVVILVFSWALFWIVYGISQGINPYSHLLQLIDSGLAHTYDIYRQQAKLQPDVLLNLEHLMNELRTLVPRILPGLLGCLVVMTVWTSMIIGNSMLLRSLQDIAPWPKFDTWQIPENFVWIAIVSALAILLAPKNIQDVGLSLGLICGLVYFFQGLSILVFYLSKWNIPGYFRITIYMIIVIQSFGFIMLTMLGLADVWINFRKLQRQDQQPNN